MNIEIKLDKRVICPAYATDGSIGLDLSVQQDVILLANSTQLVGSGVALNIKDNNVGAFIYPRSGLGHKLGVVLGNLTGVIDSDFNGEIMLSLWNRSENVVYLNKGDRVAQLVFKPIIKPNLVVVSEFSSETQRGSNGFGSSGGCKL